MNAETRVSAEEAVIQAVREASGEGRLITLDGLSAALEAGEFDFAVEASKTTAEAGERFDAVGGTVAGIRSVASGASGAREHPDEAELRSRLAEILSSHPGIASFESLSGQRVYHAPDLLSRTYARILDRKGDPLVLMAEEIRKNSEEYPRPVAVDLFENPPFDLTPEQIDEVLQALAARPEYADITFTTTAAGVVYLFSTRHLERPHAAFLAERAEALVLNP